MNKFCLIPFFGGDSSAAHSKKEKRKEYLIKTIGSLKKDFNNILITVFNNYDKDLIKDAHDNIFIIECNPVYLPSTSIRFVQKEFSFDSILVTEADHKFIINFNLIDNNLKDNNYFSPHRLEKVYNKSKLVDNNIEVKGISYNLPNTPKELSNVIDENFYLPVNAYTAFGGSFYCSERVFKNVIFKDSIEYPVEHATGFDMYHSGNKCYRTINVFDFCNIHLSGEEYLQ